MVASQQYSSRVTAQPSSVSPAAYPWKHLYRSRDVFPLERVNSFALTEVIIAKRASSRGVRHERNLVHCRQKSNLKSRKSNWNPEIQTSRNPREIQKSNLKSEIHVKSSGFRNLVRRDAPWRTPRFQMSLADFGRLQYLLRTCTK